jgi:dTMP kinase
VNAPVPRFIVLEGIDGAGTTTQARRLAEALERAGETVCRTCEPTSGPVGRFIRQALQGRLTGKDGTEPHSLPWSAMALLFAADRVDHVESTILPALRAGQTVVSDRYTLSSLTYQSLTSPEGEASVGWIRELNARAVRPDLTIVLDVSEDVAAVRRAARKGPAEIFEVSELQRRLAAAYERAESFVPHDRVLHVPDGPPDVVAERIWAAVRGG